MFLTVRVWVNICSNVYVFVYEYLFNREWVSLWMRALYICAYVVIIFCLFFSFFFFGELVLYAVLTRLYMWFFVNSFFSLFSGVLMCYFKWQIFCFLIIFFRFLGESDVVFFLFIYLYILLYCCCLISVGIPVKSNNIINCILCKSTFFCQKS